MSSSTPASSRPRMSRSKNVATRAGYLLVNTASLTRRSSARVRGRRGLPRQPLLTQPELEREEHEHALIQAGPADRAACPTARLSCLAEQLQPGANEPPVEHVTGARVAREQEIVEHDVKVGRHHDVQWDREAVFGMGGDVGRKPTRGKLPQHDFAAAAVGLEPVRQHEAEGHEILVEERYADLDAGAHAPHVDLAEHV